MYPVTARYLEAVRYPHTIHTRLEAWRAGARIDAARYGTAGIPFAGGAVTVDNSPGVRRTLDTTLAPDEGLYSLLSPIGTQLRPVSVLEYPNGATEEVPLGRFPIADQSDPVEAGPLKVSASDLWGNVQRARFLRPRASTPGASVIDTIISLMRGALGSSTPVANTVTNTVATAATVGSLLWPRDRDKAVLALAESIGVDVSIDVTGAIAIRDLPTAATAPTLTIATGPGGLILTGRRLRSRRKTYNVVVAAGKSLDAGAVPFDPVMVWDNDPLSPTYAGADPLNAPDTAGPMGVVPYFLTSDLLRTVDQAQRAATAALSRVVGLEQQTSLTTSPNLALDTFDVANVVVGPASYSLARPPVVAVIDRVTHPLDVTSSQTIDLRSTRPDSGQDQTITGGTP